MTEPNHTPHAALSATLPQVCLDALRWHGKPDALNEKRGGAWRHLSGEAVAARVRAVALGLASLGIRAGDRVALLSENRPEWSIADLAILSLGAVNVPIYTTQAVEQVRYILSDSQARVLFVSGKKVYRHARQGIEGYGKIERLIYFDAEDAAEPTDASTLEALERAGAERDARDPAEFARHLGAIKPDDLATIIYTSGTTGQPKGVMLTHAAFVSNVLAITSALPIRTDDVSLSVLPLSHIFERAVFYVFCYNGVSVYYAPSVDQLAEYLREVRPTIMTAVPRLFEKVYHRIVKKGMSAEGWRRKLFVWALEVGKRYAEFVDKREVVPPLLELQQTIASRLVFSKWREGVGGRLRFFVSGGAPLSPVLSYSFLAAGIPILQGYGMTETCITSANRPEDNKVGSIGLPFPGVEMRLDESGEILVRGACVMEGYYQHPRETAEVLDAEGWFKTGDVGYRDEHGHFFITDRKKELFKLSNGKYIAPQQIESLIKQSALVNQVVVVGAGRKTPAALVVPEWETLQSALDEQGEAAGAGGADADAKGKKKPGKRSEQHAALSRNPAAVRLVQREVAALTAGLHDYERVRRVLLLPEEFSIDGGEMTPTLKVKRRVIDEKFGALIEELYEGA
ncbi:MAG TPA: long-chain fatty acid--CoA ligase [Pyrinomonadaceae bacterium]|jgi:long-chain acyl-CoA synthetase|nr:long-chain fatty acid--CoA ligase [Pyrinomonadaceae bacterium]